MRSRWASLNVTMPIDFPAHSGSAIHFITKSATVSASRLLVRLPLASYTPSGTYTKLTPRRSVRDAAGNICSPPS